MLGSAQKRGPLSSLSAVTIAVITILLCRQCPQFPTQPHAAPVQHSLKPAGEKAVKKLCLIPSAIVLQLKNEIKIGITCLNSKVVDFVLDIV